MSESLAERIAALPKSRRALFQALAGRNGGRAAVREDPDPAPRDPGEPPVLSFAQRRLWFIDQLQPGSPAYNVPVATRIRGSLDIPALHAALQEVVDRHEVLRTVYTDQEGAAEAVPRVLDGFRLPLPVTELPDEAAIRPFYDADAAAPFDLAGAVPLRASLGRLGTQDHVLVLNLHHIVTDGWSMRLLYTELERAYAARVGASAETLPQLTLQYEDFATWQRGRISGERLEKLTSFWREELGGTGPVDLPTDRPRPPVFGHAGASRYIELPPELIAKLREFGKSEGATLYMTMLAGFAATLRRWTGQEDIVVGTSVSGRDHPAFSELIGFFVNTLPLRIRTAGDPGFAELVRATRRTTLQAYAHQELPFDLIVDALGLPRDPSRPPLTSVMFLLDETPDTAPGLAGLGTEPIDFSSRATKYDLMISVHDTGTTVRALVEYPTDLFDASTVDRLLGHFLTTLEGAVARPDAPLSALPLLTDGERRAALHDWNATRAPFPEDACLHHLFEQHADRRPDAPAVVCGGLGGWAVTYRELEERANRLAHRLIEAGAGPDRTVALCLRRGPGLVTAILAVLKAGGAYVPLDPDYPAERLALLLRDAAPPIVVSDSELIDRLPVASGTSRVLLDTDRPALGELPATRPAVPVTSRDLAYVIFTSGSTGTPKGIALEHRGVVNNLLDLNRSYGIRPGDAVLALSSPSFDMSVYETLGMLAAGGTLVLPDPAAAKDPAHWADLIQRHGVTVWNSAPALLDLLVDQLEYAGGPELPCLRTAFLGGDWIPVAQPDRIRAFAPELAFVALGGATEASIHSVEYQVGRVDPGWTKLPYGRPMANQLTYILDPNDRLVPVGVPGELHLGGVGLARGYLGRPELTEEKFVHVELEPGRTERLYRTGDLARYRPDGTIELLGRTDFRIKLNGLRIEPGEVESALRDRPGVREAVVVARQSAGSARLIGYVVPEDGAVLNLAALRTALGAVLPPHCVPTELVVLERLPLSPNGKVDRRALPESRAAASAGLAASAGSAAFAGLAGSPASAGSAGLAGSPASAGSAGLAASPASAGLAGSPGPAGSSGSAGFGGSPASAASAGSTGPAAAGGFVGSAGLAGSPAYAGSAGSPAAAGSAGAAGSVGPHGAAGSPGSAGSPAFAGLGAPRDSTAHRIAAVWAEVLGVPAVGPDDDFFALGGDSFAAVRAVRAVAAALGAAELRVVDLFSNPTPAGLAARTTELAGPVPAPYRLLHRLTPERPAGTTTLTLVCFPHGGGDAIAYQPLAAQLPPHIELLAVSPPGHDPLRPGPMLPVAEFAGLAAEEIARTVRGPYAVYGHCAGVVTALETTHVLERRGQRPVALHLAAALPEEDPEYALEMERVSSDDDLVAYLTTMDGFDGVLDDSDLTAVLRMVRHDMTEAARFFARTPDGYDQPLVTPLTCVIGDADDATEGYEQGHRAWGRYAADLRLAVIPGGRHYFAKHLPDRLAALLADLHRNGGTHV
ncbi:amino acid adenylation domain-containing protein [Streptomyces sp. A3M-1-3]|uniref:amino acid adenylation domain-containing protein n=1 Tax=Streptomyces sp. A3M-1-3 TaxID=2962044 RepID=UPI0020B7AC9E|nr:amino acid adenylation domain-containing protein [Streptomyces sp. A3M-1-3]MCP3820588.1 amino acid adenylation domain-containing protein [Streptomyces sp. A3M-1-3]